MFLGSDKGHKNNDIPVQVDTARTWGASRSPCCFTYLCGLGSCAYISLHLAGQWLWGCVCFVVVFGLPITLLATTSYVAILCEAWQWRLMFWAISIPSLLYEPTVSKAFQSAFIWKGFAEWYPIRLVKTAPLPPDRRYIFGVHPHGIISVSAFVSHCQRHSTTVTRLLISMYSCAFAFILADYVCDKRNRFRGLVSGTGHHFSYLESQLFGSVSLYHAEVLGDQCCKQRGHISQALQRSWKWRRDCPWWRQGVVGRP